MRQHRTRILGVVVAALAVLAAVLALAGGSRAASGNICTTNSGTPPSTPASCVKEIVAPPFIAAGGSAISFTKFHNEAGSGGATATHVQLNVIFPGAANVDSAAVWTAKPGSSTFTQLTSATCAKTANLSGQTVESCSAGNIAGNGTAKMIVVFDGSSGGTLTGEVTYGEGGGGPSNPPNDDQIDFGPKSTLNVGALGDGTTGSGGCFGSGGSATSSGFGQSTTVVAGQTSDPTLPCTYVDAGVRPSQDGVGSSLPMSFVDFPLLSGNGFGTVTITFPSTYKVTNKTLVDEDTNYAAPYFTTFITLASCDKKGNIVVDNKTTFVGTPPQGEMNSWVPRYYDACILSRSPSTNQVVLNVLANPLDLTARGH